VQAIAIFGPTAVGKTAIAIAVADELRARGEDPVAVGCDSIQVYRGLEALSGAPTAAEREQLEHRLVGIADSGHEFSAGQFAELARAEIDGLLESSRRPLIVGGTGLYLRAALADLQMRPPVPAVVREQVEGEIAERGPDALHAELPPELASGVHPNDRKRVSRLTELTRLGIAPHGATDGLWTERLRHPTALFGIVMDRNELHRRIDHRVDAIVAAGAPSEVARAHAAGASRTARAAIGFAELQNGDVEAMKRAQRAFARRQLTWMRRMPHVRLIDRTGRSETELAAEIVAELAD